MSQRCPYCKRPISNCYCKDIVPIKTDIKFVFLMHPKEATKQKTGTGRLSCLSLVDSEIIIDVDFSLNDRLNELLNNPEYLPLVMYPDPKAWTVSNDDFQNACLNKKLMIILIDSTWPFAKKIMRLSKNLYNIPRLSFSKEYRSAYRFKKQPHEACLSTIETCYYLINELKESSLCNSDCNPEPLLDVFNKMVEFQVQKEKFRIENNLPGNHAYDRVL